MTSGGRVVQPSKYEELTETVKEILTMLLEEWGVEV